MLNGCQVFRAVASAKEEPERTGIREPKIVFEVIAELVQGTAVTSFLLQKTKEFGRNPRTEEPKFNSKELELLACARYVPLISISQAN